MSFKVTAVKVEKNRMGVLTELIHSQHHTNVLGIILRGKKQLLTTAVRNIKDCGNNDKEVYFRETDLHGSPIYKNPVLLSEIEGVIHFNTLFDDPVYVRIREWKTTGVNNNIAA
jgi:hypothetical protein